MRHLAEEEQTVNLFAVDSERCTRCGACAAECPVGAIEAKGQDVIPTPSDSAREWCINCGHCVVACPHGALSHRSMTPEQCPPVREGWLLGAEQVEYFLRSRRSIRAYEDRAVESEVLMKLIDVARFAPTGGNRQPVRWLVVHDRDRVRELTGLVVEWFRATGRDRPLRFWEAEIDMVSRGAPHMVVVHAPKGSDADCTLALSYLDLAAASHGLGMC